MNISKLLFVMALVLTGCCFSEAAFAEGFAPGARALVEAHNCYPYRGMWSNRIDHALACGFPIGIEQDLAWHAEGNNGAGRLILAHDGPFTDREPTMRDYFFEKVRPVVEEALASGNKEHWPLITLNINDIRGGEDKMFAAVWELTGEYESWLCTAVKGESPDPIAPITVAPILVLAGGGGREQAFFYDAVPVGGKLRIFGSGDPAKDATNFCRWINFSWSAVEPEGQRKAGEWTEEEAGRLAAMVNDAHGRGYWIRFYSLNGHGAADIALNGWSPSYNFGSMEAVRLRWTAARAAGVDFIATDQCGDASAWLKQ